LVLGGIDADGVQLISAASLYKLIQRITFAQYPGSFSPLLDRLRCNMQLTPSRFCTDANLVTTFLLTYRLFLSPLELLELLLLRFDTPPPPDTDELSFNKSTQTQIRLRYLPNCS
jgi:hypothetical protein